MNYCAGCPPRVKAWQKFCDKWIIVQRIHHVSKHGRSFVINGLLCRVSTTCQSMAAEMLWTVSTPAPGRGKDRCFFYHKHLTYVYLQYIYTIQCTVQLTHLFHRRKENIYVTCIIPLRLFSSSLMRTKE